MNKEERHSFLVGAAESIMEDFEASTKRILSIFGNKNDALDKFIIPQLLDILAQENNGRISMESLDKCLAIHDRKNGDEAEKARYYSGERRNLAKLFGCDNLLSTFRAIDDLIGQGGVYEIKPGDFMMIPVKIPAERYGGLDFEGVDIKETELVVSHVFSSGRVVFQFEDVLFFSPINQKNTNEGGFSKSALAGYLNKHVENIFGEATVFLANSNDGLKITLPTQYEIFGDEDKDESTAVNWSEIPVQLDWFKKRKNRIRTKNNDTAWWWNSSPSASSAAYFCGSSYNGNSSDDVASAAGGVAPAICVS
jgi:hypothetical protein